MLEILRILAQRTRHELAIPDVVLDEYLAWRRREVTSKVEAAQSAVRGLLRTATWDRRAEWEDLEPPDVDDIVEATGAMLRERFVILDVTGDDAREALRREAARQPPAKIDDKGSGAGARDAAIWLTVLRQCPIASPSSVHFVADDHDFGRDVLDPKLRAEAPDNLYYHDGLPKLLGALAEPSKLGQSDILKVLQGADVGRAVANIPYEVDVMGEMATWVFDRKVPRTGNITGPLDASGVRQVTVVEGSAHAYTPDDHTTVIVGDIVWKYDALFSDTLVPPGWSCAPLWRAHFEHRMTAVVLERDDAPIEVSFANREPLRCLSVLRA
jgi:hypothetical protein